MNPTHQDPHAIPDVRHPTVMDVGEERVARVYAEAYLRAAEKRGQVPQALEELDSLLGDVFQADPQLETFLTSKALSRGPKAEALRKAFAGRSGEVFLNFLLVLNDNDRLDLLPAIRAAAWEFYERQSGKMRVQVRTAVPLADDQRDRLARELRQTFQREPVVVAQVDPELLGGMVVRVGDWLFDGSVRTRLQILRNQLIERSSHEIQRGRDRFSSHQGN